MFSETEVSIPEEEEIAAEEEPALGWREDAAADEDGAEEQPLRSNPASSVQIKMRFNRMCAPFQHYWYQTYRQFVSGMP